MRKFSKILESADSKIVLDIKDIFTEFTDAGFKIVVDEFQGFYNISLSLKDGIIDYMECVKDIVVSNDRMIELGMDYIKSDEITLSKISRIKLRYRLKNSKQSKDVHGWEEFKAYCENILGVDGISSTPDNKDYFRINIVNSQGFSADKEDYFGWEIETNDDIDIEEFISDYPGYEDFLRKVLKRKIKWDKVWGRGGTVRETDGPLKFDKEGIEVVEKLLEMAKKFPNKIEVRRV